MNLLKLETYFGDPQTLSLIDEEIREDLERVNYWFNMLKNNNIDNSVLMGQALAELTGIGGILCIVASFAETARESIEGFTYGDIKGKHIKLYGSEKVKETAVSKEVKSDKQLTEYRGLSDKLTAYAKSCEYVCSKLQSLLGYYRELDMKGL